MTTTMPASIKSGPIRCRAAGLLQGARNRRASRPEQDERLFMEAPLWLARTGSPWRDLPGELGRWHNVYIPCDHSRYARRNLVERFFNKLKQFRRIATRYEKHTLPFLAMLHTVSAFISIRN